MQQQQQQGVGGVTRQQKEMNSVTNNDLSSTISHTVQTTQNIFNFTKCYDLMQNSSKGTVFEVTIPFQLAFFALIEHDVDVAPLWDPTRRVFVGMMTVSDYIQALRMWHKSNLLIDQLTTISITEVIRKCSDLTKADSTISNINLFKHVMNGFQTIDVEDSISQMCLMLIRTGLDYLPVIDPDTGNLVSIVGYLDIVHLLHQTSIQFPELFSLTINQLRIGTYTDLLLLPDNTKIGDALNALEEKKVSSAPVVNELGVVIDCYHKSDPWFIIKATDPAKVLDNLQNFKVIDGLHLRDQLRQSGEIVNAKIGLVKCNINSPLSDLIHSMMISRTTKVIVEDSDKHCLGIVTIKDIIQYYI